MRVKSHAGSSVECRFEGDVWQGDELGDLQSSRTEVMRASVAAMVARMEAGRKI